MTQTVGGSCHSQHTHVGVVLTQPVNERGVLTLFAGRRQAVTLINDKELLFREFTQTAGQRLRGTNHHLPADVYLRRHGVACDADLIRAFRPYFQEFIRRLTYELFTVCEDSDMQTPFLNKKSGNG